MSSTWIPTTTPVLGDEGARLRLHVGPLSTFPRRRTRGFARKTACDNYLYHTVWRGRVQKLRCSHFPSLDAMEFLNAVAEQIPSTRGG